MTKTTLIVKPKRDILSKCFEVVDDGKKTYHLIMSNGSERVLDEELFNELFEIKVRGYIYEK